MGDMKQNLQAWQAHVMQVHQWQEQQWRQVYFWAGLQQ